MSTFNPQYPQPPKGIEKVKQIREEFDSFWNRLEEIGEFDSKSTWFSPEFHERMKAAKQHLFDAKNNFNQAVLEYHNNESTCGFCCESKHIEVETYKPPVNVQSCEKEVISRETVLDFARTLIGKSCNHLMNEVRNKFPELKIYFDLKQSGGIHNSIYNLHPGYDHQFTMWYKNATVVRIE